jgi:hypothetical protein
MEQEHDCPNCGDEFIKKSWTQKLCKDCKRLSDRAKKYGLTLEEISRMMEEQDGMCANPECRTALVFGLRGFHVDHDHLCCSEIPTCGKCVRGLLCARCNHAVGLLQDSVMRVRGLADYLDRW